MNYLIEFIKSEFENPTITLLYISLIIFSLWMYKELRSSYLENNKTYLQRIDKAIDMYSALQLEIFKYFEGESDFFMVADKILKTSSIMPYFLLTKSNHILEETNNEKKEELLRRLYEQVKNEIYGLKHNQRDIVTSKKGESAIEIIENYIIEKIGPFLLPLFYTLLNLGLFLVLILLMTSLMTESSITKKTLTLSLIVALISYVFILHIILSEVIFKKRFKNSVLNWFLFSLFTLTLMLTFIGPWYRGIIFEILIFIYAFYIGKKGLKDRAQHNQAESRPND